MKFEDMISEQGDDPILDACLSEVLGGHAPPDITARIVGKDGKLVARPRDPALATTAEAPSVVTRTPVTESPVGLARGKSIVERGTGWSLGKAIAIAAGFLGIVVLIGLTARLRSPQPQVAHTS